MNEDESHPKPQCVIFHEILSQHSLNPSLLIRHFQNVHTNLKNKPVDYFEKKLSETRESENSIDHFMTEGTYSIVEASYFVSLRIAKTGKPHTIGEILILPAAKEIVNSILGPNAASKLNTMSLSNDTVSRRIEEMSGQIKDVLIERIHRSLHFAIQFDESTDVTNFAQLMVYIRY